MLSTTRLGVITLLLGGVLAGCTPAHFVQPIRAMPLKCEVRVCKDANSAMQRCSCQTHRTVQRQLREAGYLSPEW